MAFPKHVSFCEGDKGRRFIRSLLIETTTRAKCQQQLAGSAAPEKRGNLLFNGLFDCTRLLLPMFCFFFAAHLVCSRRTDGKLRQTEGKKVTTIKQKSRKQSELKHFKKRQASKALLPFSLFSAKNKIRLSGIMLPTANMQ